MKIEYFHASKYGNGVMVAEEFKDDMSAAGIAVSIHHIEDLDPGVCRWQICTCSAPRGVSASPSEACDASCGICCFPPVRGTRS